MPVQLHLAHPLGGPSCDRLGIPRHDYATGDPVTLTREAAQALIAAGYAAGVDPTDPEAVRVALSDEPGETPAQDGGPMPPRQAVRRDTPADEA